ncbi:unnamed protein product, partial [Symbiodinium necroappetens]
VWTEDAAGTIFREVRGVFKPGRLLPVAESPQRLMAHQCYHQTEPWTGERLLLVGFTISDALQLESTHLATLRDLGFVLPASSHLKGGDALDEDGQEPPLSTPRDAAASGAPADLSTPSGGSTRVAHVSTPTEGPTPSASPSAMSPLEQTLQEGVEEADDSGDFDPNTSRCRGPPIKCRHTQWRDLVDGFGLCSPGRWRPLARNALASSGEWDHAGKIRKVLAEAVHQAILDLRKAAFALATGRLIKSPFSEKLINDVRARMAATLPDPEQALCKPDGQPFMLHMLSQSLKILGDPDYEILDQGNESFAEGVPLGWDKPIARTPQVFPKRTHFRKLDESDFDPSMVNYRSAEINAAQLEEKFRQDEQAGMMLCTTEPEARRKYGSEAVLIAAMGAVTKANGDVRPLHDGTHGINLNSSIVILDKLQVPGPEDLQEVASRVKESKEAPCSLCADISHAHRNVKVRECDWPRLACKSSSASRVLWLNKVGTFGVSSAAYYWTRLFGAVGRWAFRVLHLDKFYMLVYVDDLHVVVYGSDKFETLWILFLALEIMGTPFSFHKFKGGVNVDYIGYHLCYYTWSAGISEKRATWIIEWINQAEQAQWMVTGRQLTEFIGRLNFVTRLLAWLKPFLAPLFAWLSGQMLSARPAGSCWVDGRVRTLSLGNVRRHGNSSQHARAAKQAGFDGVDDDEDAAPSLENFTKVLQARLEGRPLCSKVEGMGSWKIGKMTFCLAEAAREKTRQEIREAESIALKMDSREGVLLLRYTCCDQSLTISRGMVGFKFIPERETSSALVAGVRRVLEDLCTSGTDGQLDVALVNHFCEKVEVVCADKASNEQVAGRMCRTGPSAMFPNAKVVNHDSSHAMQRPALSNLGVLKRPWAAVEPIQRVIEEWVTGANSVSQMIEHSNALASVYRSYVQKLEGLPINARRIKDLRAAKHRFASLQKPLGRAVLTFDAMLSTILWAAAHRSGAERDRCMSCLASLSEEGLILLAMSADIADENIRVLRLCDQEEFDAAEFPQELGCLIDRLHFLVNKGGVLSQGYTQYMIDYLQDQRGFLLKNEARTLGGEDRVNAQMLAGCCNIFKAYVRLAVHTVEQEFPCHDVLSAMSVLNIREKRKNEDTLEHLMWTEHRQASLERLAQVCRKDPQALRDQFMDLEPIARYEVATNHCSSFEGWRAAVLRCRASKPQVRQRHKTDVILPVLIKYGCFCGLSASGVEQSFSKLQRFQPKERKCMLPTTAEDEASLMLLHDCSVHQWLSQRGRQIWLDNFGKPRASCATRIDRGVPKRKDPQSEKAFIKRRRVEVDKGALPVDPAEVLQAAQNGCWVSQAVLEEEGWQVSEKYDNKVMAYLDGALLESEVDLALVETAVALRTHQAGLDAGRVARENAIVQQLRPKKVNVQAGTFYVADAGWVAEHGLSNSRATVTLAEASHYVVADPGNPGMPVLFAAALQGGMLCNVEYARTKGNSGVAFAFDAALLVKRFIFLSTAFLQSESQVAQVVVDAVRSRQSKWSQIHALDEFVDRSLRFRGQKKNFLCVGLFADSEEQKIAEEPNMFTKKG